MNNDCNLEPSSLDLDAASLAERASRMATTVAALVSVHASSGDKKTQARLQEIAMGVLAISSMLRVAAVARRAFENGASDVGREDIETVYGMLGSMCDDLASAVEASTATRRSVKRTKGSKRGR